jgi:hypothetical protein
VPYRLDCRQSCGPWARLRWRLGCVSCVCSESLYFTLSGLWPVIRWCCDAFRSSQEGSVNSETIERGSRHNRNISRGARRFNDATRGRYRLMEGRRRRRILIDSADSHGGQSAVKRGPWTGVGGRFRQGAWVFIGACVVLQRANHAAPCRRALKKVKAQDQPHPTPEI